MVTVTRHKWKWKIAALGVCATAAAVALFYYFRSESYAVKGAVAQLNSGDWRGLFNGAIADERSLMECDAAGFSALMESVMLDKSFEFRLQDKYVSAGGRPTSIWVIDVYDESGNRYENTLSLYVAEQSGRHRVSVADLPFQLALIGSEDRRASLAALASSMEANSVERLLNPREMIVANPARIRSVAASSEAEFDPAYAWTRMNGF